MDLCVHAQAGVASASGQAIQAAGDAATVAAVHRDCRSHSLVQARALRRSRLLHGWTVSVTSALLGRPRCRQPARDCALRRADPEDHAGVARLSQRTCGIKHVGAEGRDGPPSQPFAPLPPLPPNAQKSYLIPDCRMRGPLPPAGVADGVSACVVIRPNVEELKLITGSPQLNVLNRLKVSTRSSIRCVPNGTSLEIARSIWRNAGPTAALRGRLPKVPGAGCAKASRLK